LKGENYISVPAGRGQENYKQGLNANLVVWLIDLLLVFASQKIVDDHHDVRDEMAKLVQFRKEFKDSLTRQGMQNIKGLHRKRLAGREEKERVLLSERAHKRVLKVKKNMHLILKSSTGTIVVVTISIAQKEDSTA